MRDVAEFQQFTVLLDAAARPELQRLLAVKTPWSEWSEDGA